ILQDFSIANMTPVVVASVIANVTTQKIFQYILRHPRATIFSLKFNSTFQLDWFQVQNFILLGLICGAIGVTMSRLMYFTEHHFKGIPVRPAFRPAIGGALLGCLGIVYVLTFGHLRGVAKPVPFDVYPAPVFYGDGYGFLQSLLSPAFYTSDKAHYLF